MDNREWQRLDRLMLLVHPIRELIRFLPVLLGLLLAGSRSGGNEWWWNVLGIGVPIALGIARYLTTSFRIYEGRVDCVAACSTSTCCRPRSTASAPSTSAPR